MKSYNVGTTEIKLLYDIFIQVLATMWLSILFSWILIKFQ